MNNLVSYLTENEFDAESMEDYKSRIGNNISNMRANVDMTQKDLAKAVDYHRQTINRIEKGRMDFPSSKLAAIAMELNVTPSDILYRKYHSSDSGK